MEYGNTIEDDTLKIGDYITIKNLRLNSFLCAEGILFEDIVVNDSIESFEDALFCIHLQRQYSASTELETFTKTYNIDVSATLEDANTAKYLNALQRGRDNEAKLNESYMKQKMGTTVLFGDVIQLMHVKSGKFVTIIPAELARDERENIRINLTPDGNSHSWLQIIPRYKIDREGDRILSNTEVVLKVAERPNEFIHCSEKDPPPDYAHEVNCSLENSSWKLSLFQNVKDTFEPSHLMCTELVLIHDPESLSNLTVYSKKKKQKKIEVTADLSIRQEGTFAFPSPADVCEVSIKPASTDDEQDTNSVWVMESRRREEGGHIQWKSDMVRFRSLNTGRYLVMDGSAEESTDSLIRLATTEAFSDPGTLFSVQEVYGNSSYLCVAKAVQFNQNGMWLARGPFDEDADAMLCVGSRDKNQAVSFLINRYTDKLQNSRGDDSTAAMMEPMDVHVGVAARNYLSKVVERTKIPTNDFSAGTLWPGTDRSEIKFFSAILGKAINFVQGKSIFSDKNSKPETPNKQIILNRQNMICDQGTLDIVIRLIEKLIPISVRTDSTVGGVGNKHSTSKSEEEKAVMKMGGTILKHTLNLLYYIIVNNNRNQMLVGDAMPILLAHVGAQSLAAKCVTDMLNSNMELNEEKIGYREISIFTEKLRSSKMNCMYLNLIRACCSCQGKGVVGNQATVTEVVFKDFNDIIIQVHADSARPFRITWKRGLYIPERVEPSSPILGQVLMTKGLPVLSLSWTTNSIDFSPLGLFGKLSVNIQELYGLNAEGQQVSSGHTNKAAVAEYFTSEMFLAADMCLDRNYLAMRRMEPLFTYEMLVSMIKMDVNESLKSAAVKLLLRLYVDRDPQVVSAVPCLTRTWSEVSKDSAPQLPHVDISRQNHFALLQQIISEHIQDMKGCYWDGLSRHMMELMNKLVMFNFYGSQEKLLDVIEPLINAIDRRGVEHNADGQDGTLSRQGTSKSIKRAKSFLRGPKIGSELTYGSKGAVIDGVSGLMDEGDEQEEAIPWQKTTLTFLQSLVAIVFVVLLVVVALSVAISQEFTKDTGPGYTYFEYFVTAVFCVELTLRFYCYVYVNRVVIPFFSNILNVIDLVVVIIDLVILGAPDALGSGAQYTKALRAARLVRLVRVFRAARLVQKLKDMSVKKFDSWKMPARYSKVPTVELDTIVEAVNILSYVKRIIEDRNLSLLLKGFHAWESGATTLAPVDILKQTIVDAQDLSLGCEGFDDIFIDNLMLNNPTLTQALLHVLMAHHSSTAMLLENAKNVQLLVSAKRERQYRNIDHFLLDLERYTETNELWASLLTEADCRTNKAVRDILNDLTDLCRLGCKELKFDSDFTPDKSIQDLLRNLGFFDICFKVLHILDGIDEVEKPVAARTNYEIVCICNELLYWFLLDNPQNQALAFEVLDFFFHSLDMKIGSHRIIQAIFSSNEALMIACPRSLIFEFTEKVCHQGKHPQYLSLLASITNVGEKNILENQYEIVKQMISPTRLPRMVAFFCPVSHEDYQRKVDLMEPYLSRKDDISVDELPSELAYHLEFLRVLSGCTVGRTNITTVEAKVQSVFDFRDIIDHIMDPRCILVAKTRLALFLFNAVIEVEIQIPEIPTSARIWTFLESLIPVFEAGASNLQDIEKRGWYGSSVRRQEVEYMMVGVMIVAGFFQTCYDASRMKLEDTAVPGGDVSNLSIAEVNDIISGLFEGVKGIYDVNSTSLSAEHKQYIVEAMDGLNKGAGKSLIMEITNTLIASDEMDDKSVSDDDETEGRSNQEERITQKYDEFIAALVDSEEVSELFVAESKEFVSKIESLPFISDNTVADVRYEPFIKKLVAHVRDQLEIVENEKRLDSHCVQTTTWLIRCFRTMIENKWKMSIYERDDDGGEEEDIAAAPVVNALNSCGATILCLDLISVGIDPGLMLESVKLCVAMLFLEGGNLAVQQTMYEYLSSNNSELFFKQMRISIQKLVAWHKWHDVIVLQEGEDPDLPDDTIIVRFLQLMCEGHYQANQDIMREQPNNETSVNLLDDFVSYLNAVSRIPCRTSTVAGITVSATILEVIQGPCMKNQEYFVLNTELVETINRLMRSTPVRDCDLKEELELKKTGIDILQGLLEGQGSSKTVYERVLSVIHLDIIQMMSAPPPAPKDDDEEGMTIREEVDEEVDEAMSMLRTESLVLLQMLCDYKPSLRAELEFVKDAADIVGSEVACVEILWRGELQRRFFHVPNICSDLAKSSKDTLVEEVDRSNIESKLQDFVYRSHELYREIKHQQVLKEWNVSGIFSRSNQNTATWISFFLALLINFIMLCFYSAKSGVAQLPPEIVLVVDALNLFQLVFASFTLVLFLVVRVPVKYQHFQAAGCSTFMTIVNTGTDALTMYYFVYVVLCLLAIIYSDTFLTFLLLDVVVKNSTTRDVLYAVINPRKQLAMTLLLGIFIAYIFSFFIFYNFRDELIDDAKKDCTNLYNCFKSIVAYGIRWPNGTGDFMTHSLGKRLSVDLLFFLVVMVVLLNVIFGIIIDTFGDLRSKKIERLQDTTEKCFICGIDKPVFDRASDTPNGFKTHIRFDHNMWNYLYFIVYVWEQDKDDDDGLEQFVRRCLDSNDLSWFPMNRAMRLASTVSAEEELRANLSSDVESSDKNLMQKINLFQSDIGDSLDKILFYLKSDEPEEHAPLEPPPATTNGQFEDGFEDNELVPPAAASISRGSRSSRRPQKKTSVSSRGDVSYLSDGVCSTEDDVNRMAESDGNKQITLQAESVEGIAHLNIDNMEVSGQNIFCRVISETGRQDIPASSVSNGLLTFEKLEIIVSQNSSSEDTGICVIELHRVSPDNDAELEVVGRVAISYSELIRMSNESSRGATVEFQLVENAIGAVRSPTGAFLRFYITCAAAIDLPTDST